MDHGPGQPRELGSGRTRGAAVGAPLRLALAGGGTGGHVVPGLAVLEHLTASGILDHALWIGSGRSAERRALEGLEAAAGPASVERVVLPLERANGGAPSRIGTLARLPRAVALARRALVQSGSEVLLGLGGFASVSAVLAARSLGLPVVLLEVNAAPGLATRLLGPLVQRVLHSAAPSLPRGRESRRHRVVGPTLGPRYAAPMPSEPERAARRAQLGFEPTRPLLAVLGGSQGAGAFNRFVGAHVDRLVSSGISVLHQVGPGRLAESAGGRPHYKALEYVSPVLPALDGATVVLVRAGASTLAEVVARRTAAIVVPYPHAAGDHQRHNALQLGDGVWLVPESGLDGALVERILQLAGPGGAQERKRMAETLATRPQPRGASQVIEELLDARAKSRAPSWNPAPKLAGGHGR
ncbi:MAG: hypothetical protein GC161_17205 [Planctomycetaceae bacterium]|nr:hypothetical protein [Planctomycetaceae bacterium]